MKKIKELKKTTKKAQKILNQYKNAKKNNCKKLDDVYTSFSNKKYIAFNYCLKLKNDLNGIEGYIISSNINVFTYAFISGYDLIYITPTQHICIKDMFI